MQNNNGRPDLTLDKQTNDRLKNLDLKEINDHFATAKQELTQQIQAENASLESFLTTNITVRDKAAPCVQSLIKIGQNMGALADEIAKWDCAANRAEQPKEQLKNCLDDYKNRLTDLIEQKKLITKQLLSIYEPVTIEHYQKCLQKIEEQHTRIDQLTGNDMSKNLKSAIKETTNAITEIKNQLNKSRSNKRMYMFLGLAALGGFCVRPFIGVCAHFVKSLMAKR